MNPFLQHLSYNLYAMKRWCIIQEEEYWALERVLPMKDLVLDPPQNVSRVQWRDDPDQFSEEVLYFELVDGYEIMMGFSYDAHGYPLGLMGVIRIPSWCPFTHDFLKSAPMEELELLLGMEDARLWPYEKQTYTLRWSHDRIQDAIFSQPAVEQPDRLVSGPVQVFEEALRAITYLRLYESYRTRYEKARQTFFLEEELMQRVWHPKRVEAWILAGMDI
jgi:hypothetical protein